MSHANKYNKESRAPIVFVFLFSIYSPFLKLGTAIILSLYLLISTGVIDYHLFRKLSSAPISINMNHSQMIRSMLQAQDDPIRTDTTTSKSRKQHVRSAPVTQEDVIRFHVKSMLARDHVLSSKTNESSILFSQRKKQPRRLPIRDAPRVPEPTFYKIKHEQIKKEVALRRMAKKLKQRAKEEKKQIKRSLKK